MRQLPSMIWLVMARRASFVVGLRDFLCTRTFDDCKEHFTMVKKIANTRRGGCSKTIQILSRSHRTVIEDGRVLTRAFAQEFMEVFCHRTTHGSEAILFEHCMFAENGVCSVVARGDLTQPICSAFAIVVGERLLCQSMLTMRKCVVVDHISEDDDDDDDVEDDRECR
jgi:predicted metal-binding protein